MAPASDSNPADVKPPVGASICSVRSTGVKTGARAVTMPAASTLATAGSSVVHAAVSGSSWPAARVPSAWND
jgi:hypothetical protein